jgi:hypothetical protein
MNITFKQITVAAALLLSVGATAQAANIDAGYVQNFDGMGTTTTLPTDWSIWKVGDSHSTWTSSITANGSTHSVSAMTSAGTTLKSALFTSAITSSTRNAQGYNIAQTGTTDRVLSTSPTSVDGSAIQLSLTNNTAATINSLNISYDIVKFYGGKQQDTAPYHEELPGYQLFYSINNGAWTNISALNPVEAADGIHPVVPLSTNTTGVLDYNVTSISNSLVALATGWGSGKTLRLRWVDDNAETLSPDQIIGLNNVNVTPTPVPAAAWLLGSGLLGLAGLRRREKQQ